MPAGYAAPDHAPRHVRTAADVHALVGGCDAPALHAVHLDFVGRLLGVIAAGPDVRARDLLEAAVALRSIAIVVTETTVAPSPRPDDGQRARCADLVVAAPVLGIRLLDYLLFGRDGFWSFRAEGQL